MTGTLTSDSRNALTKALEVLDVMLSDNAPLTVLDIGNKLSLPRQTAHRLVDQLEQAGMVSRQLGTKSRFVIGPRLAALSITSLRQIWHNGPVFSVLQQISIETNAVCAVAVLDRDAVVFIHSACAPNEDSLPMCALEKSLPTHRFPVHASAAGKLLAAHRHPRARKRIAFGILHDRFTRATITDASALEAEFDTIARRGYALSLEEYQSGLVDLAVPVRNPQGDVVVALCTMATVDVCSAHDLERQRGQLQDAVVKLERQIALQASLSSQLEPQ